jgi:hypothetical protein
MVMGQCVQRCCRCRVWQILRAEVHTELPLLREHARLLLTCLAVQYVHAVAGQVCSTALCFTLKAADSM